MITQDDIDAFKAWNDISEVPEDELVMLFGRHKDGSPWWNVGTKFGTSWDGPWLTNILKPTHFMFLVEPKDEE